MPNTKVQSSRPRVQQDPAYHKAEQAKLARIRELYKEEETSPVIARKYGEIPAKYEEITDEWLTATIAKDVPGAQVVSHSLDNRDSGTSNRRRIYLTWNEKGKSAGLPNSVFCKATTDLINRLILSSWGTLTEVHFFNKVRPTLEDFEAPTAIFAAYDNERYTSMIMLDDLAGKVTFTHATTYFTKEMAKSQLDLLAKLHGKFYKNVGLIQNLATFYGRTENMIIHHNLQNVIDQGFRESKSVIPARLYARADEVWDATINSIDRNKWIVDRAPTACHGDVHPGNWYQLRNGKMGLNDWQCITRGAWQRDLCYVISAGLTVEDRRAWEKELVTYYLAALKSNGGPVVSEEDTWREMKGQLPTALSFWTMTLTPGDSFPDMQKEDVTIEIIKRIATMMDDHNALDVWQELGDFTTQPVANGHPV